MQYSIIVPVYNAQASIAKCVQSVLAQENQDFELVLVDDGSTDGSFALCRQLAEQDGRIVAIHQENGGPSHARNTGIDASRGESIVFLDSDDYVTPRYLSAFSEAGDFDFEIQGFSLRYDDGRPECDKMPRQTRSCDVPQLLAETVPSGLILGPVCKRFKRSILVEHGIRFPEELTYGEDAVFVKRYLLHCSTVRTIAECNYAYVHTGAETLTSKFHDGKELMASTEKDYDLFQAIKKQWPLSPETDAAFLRSKAIDYYQAIYNLFVDKKYSRAEVTSFVKSINPDFAQAMSAADGIPPTFQLIRTALRMLPTNIAVSLLTASII